MDGEIPAERSKLPVNLPRQSSLHELMQERQKEAAKSQQPFKELKVIEVRCPVADIGHEPIVGYYDAEALDDYFQSLFSDLGTRKATVTIVNPHSKEEIATMYEDHRPPKINYEYFRNFFAYTIRSATDPLHRINSRDALPQLFSHIGDFEQQEILVGEIIRRITLICQNYPFLEQDMEEVREMFRPRSERLKFHHPREISQNLKSGQKS